MASLAKHRNFVFMEAIQKRIDCKMHIRKKVEKEQK